MEEKKAKIRLFVDEPLGAAQLIPLPRDKAHYLFGVMRLETGAMVALFNGCDGEWTYEVVSAGKHKGMLKCVHQSQPQSFPPDLWLLFAPIKKARTDFIVEKAAEMGASAIFPVQTDFTNSERIKRDRLQAHAVEAAEQCGGTFVPPVHDLQKLDQVIANWDKDRQIMFCDESLVGVQQSLAENTDKKKWAVLIGPEGGFSMAERTQLRAKEFVTPVSLGPRILRADTAAVAALALWQNQLGDWR